MKLIALVICTVLSQLILSAPLPPTDPQHPGFPTRSGSFSKIEINYIREGSYLFLPQKTDSKVPLVVFAHGQALKLKNYELLFENIASRGIAVFYPQYDKGFFDTDWVRMGKDYDTMVINLLEKFDALDSSRVVYSGHSKGGYVGLMALGHRGQQNTSGVTSWSPRASIFYSPAGYEDDAISKVEKDHPVHLVWPKGDSIIDESLINEIYEKLPTLIKQKITIQGYDDLEAGHFFPLTKRAIFGGSNGFGPFHYYGIIPWTFGALEESSYLYGDLVYDSGDTSFPHLVLRSF